MNYSFILYVFGLRAGEIRMRKFEDLISENIPLMHNSRKERIRV